MRTASMFSAAAERKIAPTLVESTLPSSTMCIGNLRSGMDSLCAWLVGGNAKAFGKAVHYFAIIFLFALGAGIGSVALLPMAGRAIWLSCLLLGVSFCLMFLKEDIEELEQLEQMEAHKK